MILCHYSLTFYASWTFTVINEHNVLNWSYYHPQLFVPYQLRSVKNKSIYKCDHGLLNSRYSLGNMSIIHYTVWDDTLIVKYLSNQKSRVSNNYKFYKVHSFVYLKLSWYFLNIFSVAFQRKYFKAPIFIYFIM